MALYPVWQNCLFVVFCLDDGQRKSERYSRSISCPSRHPNSRRSLIHYQYHFTVMVCIYTKYCRTRHHVIIIVLPQVPANHLLSASVMSAPAALAISKLFYPETEKSKTTVEDVKDMEQRYDQFNF